MGRRRWSWRARVGWGLLGWALLVLCVALPLWALTAGDINEVAGWANILALPVSAMGVVLVVAEGARTGSGGFGRSGADVSSGSGALAVRPPAPARPTPRQLPPDVTHFTGRSADMAELDAMLALTTAGKGAALVISAVSGAAGVGKTALAIHWAHRVGDHFPDGALYVNLRGYGDIPVSPEQAINGFLRALGVTSEIIPWELEEQAALFRTVLNQRRMLVVLDNASNAEQVRPLLPAAPGCMVVVTSRSRLSGLVVRDGAHRVTLDQLSPAEAVALLRRVIGAARVAAEPEAAAEVARRCEHLPLALRIVAEHAVTHPRLSLTALADELAAEHSRLDLMATSDDDATSIRAVFTGSYRALSPDAARAFRLLGLHTGPDISTPAAAALVDQSVPKTRLLLDTLANVHLLEETGPDRYRLHDLLRDYAVERAAADESEDVSSQAVGRIHAWYLHSMDAAARIVNSQADHVPLDLPPRGCEPMRFASHRDALTWCDAERSNLVAAVYHAAQKGQHAIAWKLAVALTRYFTLRWHLADWITTHRIGLDAARHLNDRYGEGRIINGLGGAYRALQQFGEALKYSRQAIAIFQQTGHRKAEGMARNNVGAICGDLHRFDEALDNLAQARAICREINDQNGECSTLIHFGLTYQRLHQHEEAIDYFNQALELCRKTGARQKEREVMRNIGSTLRILGRHTEATEYFHQALQISRDIGERWGEADSLQGLGQVLHDLGELDQAHQVWRDALTIFDHIDPSAGAHIRNHLQTVQDGAESTPEPEVPLRP